MLDAQFFGVAQRRRRVFGVFARADIGAASAAKILSLLDRSARNFTPRSGARPSLTDDASDCAGDCGPDDDRVDVAAPRAARQAKGGFTDPVSDNIIAQTFDWQAGVSRHDRTWLHDKPGRTRSLTAHRTLAVNISKQDTPSDTDDVIAFSSKDDGRDAVSDLAPTLRSLNFKDIHINGGGQVAIAFALRGRDGGSHKRADRPNGGMYVNETDTALTVGSTDQTVIAFQQNQRDELRDLGDTAGALGAEPGMHNQNFVAFSPFTHYGYEEANISATLHNPHMFSGSENYIVENQKVIAQNGSDVQVSDKPGVRRLMPVECERLQGFPDDWTAGQADSVRYRQMGNAVAVPVVQWVARRLATYLESNHVAG